MPFQGERAFITFTDEAPDDAYSFWLETMLQTSFRHIHFGGLEHSSVIGPLTSLAHDRGATVSMDCYDTPLLHDPECDWPCLLYGVDVFMPNAREARLITKRPTVRDALLNLCEYVPRVVIKDGPHGAWIGVGSSIEHVETVTVGDVIDTTGAGDCFNAGYLFGSVVLGLPDAEAARCGNICGAFSVTGIGGATAAPTRAQLDSILMAMPGR
jgi:sugar/nucleoside kinase (ribokinase family)